MRSQIDSQGLRGYVLRYLGAPDFKLAMIVGYEGMSTCVRFWSSAKRRWSKSIKQVRMEDLAPLTEEEKAARQALIKQATRSDLVVHLRPHV